MAFTSPLGSGGMLRRMAEAATRMLRELDAATGAPSSPPSFGPDNLGDALLFSIDGTGRVFTVRTVGGGKGAGQLWVGPANTRSKVFAEMGEEYSHPMDRAKFIDYVFNFRHVLYDRKDGTLRPVDEDFAVAVASGWAEQKQPLLRAHQVAAGVRS